MNPKTCIQCGKELVPTEDNLNVETYCISMYLCEKCAETSRTSWEQRMAEARRNRDAQKS